MPDKFLKVCLNPGCNELTRDSYCRKHKIVRYKQYDGQRGNANERGYTYKWQQYRKRFLEQFPYCETLGCRELATVVDHIIPHKGDMELFWDESNHQPLCNNCHDRKTAREDGGFRNKGNLYFPKLPRPNVSVIIVCGAPASGKSAYVSSRAKANDIVIDLDIIRAEQTGLKIYEGITPENRDKALIARNRILEQLKAASGRTAWFIVSAPTKRERQHWKEQLAGVVVLVDPGIEACCSRLIRDDRRRDKQLEYKDAIFRWYERFEEGIIDKVIK